MGTPTVRCIVTCCVRKEGKEGAFEHYSGLTQRNVAALAAKLLLVASKLRNMRRNGLCERELQALYGSGIRILVNLGDFGFVDENV